MLISDFSSIAHTIITSWYYLGFPKDNDQKTNPPLCSIEFLTFLFLIVIPL